MLKRKRVGDPKTLDEFVKLEDEESQSEESGQQLGETSKMADVTFVNDSDDKMVLEIAFCKLLEDIEL
jgi:hypothetical protein